MVPNMASKEGNQTWLGGTEENTAARKAIDLASATLIVNLTFVLPTMLSI